MTAPPPKDERSQWLARYSEGDVHDFDDLDTSKIINCKFTQGLSGVLWGAGDIEGVTTGDTTGDTTGNPRSQKVIQQQNLNTKKQSLPSPFTKRLQKQLDASMTPIKEDTHDTESLTKEIHNHKKRLPPKTPHKRHPSVNISLTPAQKVESTSNTRSSNALENFEFGELVGKGAFSSVYKGVNKLTNQVVAIKQITLDPNSDDVKTIMGEIDLLKILKHPYIVKYHGFVKTSTSLNVFLEFCSGGSLRQLYKRLGHGLPESQVIPYTRSILKGLAYLHQQGVVHRDVKAANVLLTDSNSIKLADFGVATQISKANEYTSVVGTPNWMAPETVLGGEGICTASDIWSLGATIIELLTTRPPYHELNPMATLHAIGTDDHPPLPKGISQMAQSFLMECFQKQPTLRKSAKLLLKHKWLDDDIKKPPMRMVSANSLQVKTSTNNMKSIHSYSEDNTDNWDELPINQIELSKKIKQLATPLSKTELLNKFSDGKDEELEDLADFENIILIKNDKSKLNNYNKENNNKDIKYNNNNNNNNNDNNDNDNIYEEEEEEEEEEKDPFDDLSLDSFDTNELENQYKLEMILQKFTRRVDASDTDNEEVWSQLTRLTGKMLHIMKKYQESYIVLVREHGMLTIMDLLEKSQERPHEEKLWIHCLAILNFIFKSSIIQLENFCLLGGIPVFMSFTSTVFTIQIRHQVAKFVKCLFKSDRALLMFVSSGGLKIVSKFAEEDYDAHPDFPLTAIEIVYTLLSKDDLARSKSDVCRILAKYGVVFWFAVVLNRLTKDKEQVHSKQIIQIFGYFGQSEPRARLSIASTDLFKLLIRIYRRIDFEHQLGLLKFFKSMSCVSDILRKLYAADILEFIAELLTQFTPQTPHYKEVTNILCPIMYNCCYLNHAKELELVHLGVVNNLKALSKINLPFRQFVLPIVCELVYCDRQVRQILYRCDILETYLSLVVDPYWQSNALDSIWAWYQQNDPCKPNFESLKVVNCFVSGFILNKASSIESTLDTYLKFISASKYIREGMFQQLIIENIQEKLDIYIKNPVVSLKLLRILKMLMQHGKGETYFNMAQAVVEKLATLGLRTKSVLVDEMSNDIIKMIQGD